MIGKPILEGGRTHTINLRVFRTTVLLVIVPLVFPIVFALVMRSASPETAQVYQDVLGTALGTYQALMIGPYAIAVGLIAGLVNVEKTVESWKGTRPDPPPAPPDG